MIHTDYSKLSTSGYINTDHIGLSGQGLERAFSITQKYFQTRKRRKLFGAYIFWTTALLCLITFIIARA